MSKDSGTIYFIAGLLMGGMVGAGIGMYLAPDDKTREEMKKTGGDILAKSVIAAKKFEKETLTPSLGKLAKTVEKTVEKTVKEIRTEGLEEAINKAVGNAKKASVKKTVAKK